MRTALASILALGLAAPAAAEIYRWTDAGGAVHYTQDLSQVPARQRPAARDDAEAPPAADRLQRYEGAASAKRRVVRRSGPIRIPFRRSGTLMIVDVELDDQVRAPFIVDTGASGVSIPRALADRLGLRIGPDTPRVMVHTANGAVAEPVVDLAAVQVGDARVEGLEAVVNSSMQIGLLGGSFFNNFVYQVDAAAGEITLHPNERMRGGLSEEQWGERFRELRGLLASIDEYAASAPRGRARELGERRASLAASLEKLERAANHAQVPQAWRD